MTDGVDSGRRRFLANATSVIGGVGVAFAAVPFIGSWQPSEKAYAAGAPVEVDLSKIPTGAQITVPWRGQPIWIVHRTKDSLSTLSNPDLVKELRDPNSDMESQQPTYAINKYRSIKPEFLVMVGLCTHLGCVPVYHPEKGSIDSAWEGGFFCPCHGSKYDMAGRVYKGVPAPLNMPIPPYRYISDTKILIGEDDTGVTSA